MSLLCSSFKCFVFAAALLIVPATAQSASLSPQAQNAFDHGLAATQQQDWQLAVRYFLDAQKVDPDASQIWFNLGLASAKNPGHEFRAIAWFKAYLLANPDANNATAVQAQITQLEVAFEARLTKIVDALEPIAKLIVDNETVISLRSGNEKPESKKELRTPDYVYFGSLLTAMRLYLGDKKRAEKTRQLFGMGNGTIPQGFLVSVPAHLDRALASVGSYDELLGKDKDGTNHWNSHDFEGTTAKGVAADRVLFAFERDDIDTGEKLDRFSGFGCRKSCLCKRADLGRWAGSELSSYYWEDNEKEEAAFRADTANWFATYCSGWWLKKGDISGLKARGRDGQIIVVKDSQDKAVAQYDDTSVAAFLDGLKQHLQSQKKKNYGDLSGRDVRDSLASLADLYEAYRQVHGPYDH